MPPRGPLHAPQRASACPLEGPCMPLRGAGNAQGLHGWCTRGAWGVHGGCMRGAWGVHADGRGVHPCSAFERGSPAVLFCSVLCCAAPCCAVQVGGLGWVLCHVVGDSSASPTLLRASRSTQLCSCPRQGWAGHQGRLAGSETLPCGARPRPHRGSRPAPPPCSRAGVHLGWGAASNLGHEAMGLHQHLAWRPVHGSDRSTALPPQPSLHSPPSTAPATPSLLVPLAPVPAPLPPCPPVPLVLLLVPLPPGAPSPPARLSYTSALAKACP